MTLTQWKISAPEDFQLRRSELSGADFLTLRSAEAEEGAEGGDSKGEGGCPIRRKDLQSSSTRIYGT